MTVRSESYLRREANKMYVEEAANSELRDLIQRAQDVLTTNSKTLKSNQEMENARKALLERITVISRDISNSIPDNSRTFRKLKKSSEKYSTDLSNKVDLINDKVTISSKVVSAMTNNLQFSKKELQPISTSIDNYIKLYKNGEISTSKESIRELMNLKNALDDRYTEVSKLESKYNQYAQKVNALKIPESSKDFITPNNLQNNRRGLYLPKNLKTYLEVMNEYVKSDLSLNLPKQVDDIEQKLKSITDPTRNFSYKEKLKVYFEKSILTKKYSDVLLNIDSQIMLNYITGEKVSGFINSLERDSTQTNCFFKQTKGYEHQYEEMLTSLRQIEKQLKEEDKMLSNLTKKIRNINMDSEKEQKTFQKEFLQNKSLETKASKTKRNWSSDYNL